MEEMDNGGVGGGCVEEDLKLDKGVCSSEEVNGSRDLWSCTEASVADHLVVMVHGILGRLGFRCFFYDLRFLLSLGFC